MDNNYGILSSEHACERLLRGQLVFKYLFVVCICCLFEFKYFNYLYQKKKKRISKYYHNSYLNPYNYHNNYLLNNKKNIPLKIHPLFHPRTSLNSPLIKIKNKKITPHYHQIVRSLTVTILFDSPSLSSRSTFYAISNSRIKK